MCHIRAAEKNDVDILNRIAYDSEAYWGYDLEYMKRFEEVYRITEEYVMSNPTFILFEANVVVGFYSLSVHDTDIYKAGNTEGNNSVDNRLVEAAGIQAFSAADISRRSVPHTGNGKHL